MCVRFSPRFICLVRCNDPVRGKIRLGEIGWWKKEGKRVKKERVRKEENEGRTTLSAVCLPPSSI